MGRTTLAFPGDLHRTPALPGTATHANAGPWTTVTIGFASARALQILCHFLVRTPYGPRLIETNPENLPRAIFYATVATSILVVAFRLLGHAAGRALGLRGERGALVLFTAVISVYLFLGEMDLELMRWLGQHVSVGWIRAYSWKPDVLKLRLLESDLIGSSVALVLATVPALVLAGVAAFNRPLSRLRWRSTGLLAIPMLAGIGVAIPDAIRKPAEFRSVQPPLFTMWDEAVRHFTSRIGPAELTKGVETLHTVLRRPESAYPVVGYPLWREVSDEASRFARFRALPVEEKPDVVVVLLESAQGWEFDLRRPEARQSFPNLTALFRERGVLYPYCQSVGFPSPEGRVGVHLGIWSHPSERIIERYQGIRTLALPQILARGGYSTALVTAGDPDFDRMQPWYDRWYQRWEYDPRRSDDLSAAGRALETLAELPAERPRFLLFNTVTMHAPYTFPGSSREPHASFHTRYMQAARYTDAALGRLFDGLRRSGRWSRTVVVVVGDHATTGPWIGFQAPRAGTPNAAETWIPLLVAAPGFAGGQVKTELASQLDVPPTVLALAGIEASNHFLGRDLFTKDPGAAPPIGAFSFRNGGLAVTLGPVRYQLQIDDPRFVKKTLYAAFDADCADRLPNGCYRNGTPLPHGAEDEELLEDVRRMALAYGELFEKDRLMPLSGALAYRPDAHESIAAGAVPAALATIEIH